VATICECYTLICVCESWKLYFYLGVNFARICNVSFMFENNILKITLQISFQKSAPNKNKTKCKKEKHKSVENKRKKKSN
jgi:hypothetical protein